ncbi:MAG TPA: dTDP-4-dehydrorhamnose 3,5-epimerase [Anaerolineae bacterium]|nr:dTDP-4-dehydrorhamnose 3,5-epimerase [Anaerolineae bacterium]HMR62663.1 dTDP-4-dehydrorhamnose 3,5-epimerase [Anaerolineae bacterium]
MPQITESDLIRDVQMVKFNVFGDDRGRFHESFRKEWFPQRSWERVQSNCSKSKSGVLRGLHYHFQQVDFWMVAAGSIRAALYDLRLDSPTHGAAQTLDIGDNNPIGIFIPVGVAHGFVTLTDATLIYIVDNYYNGSDEFGVAWDDPDIAIPWGIANPMVSARDAKNPRLSQIPPDKLPR